MMTLAQLFRKPPGAGRALVCTQAHWLAQNVGKRCKNEVRTWNGSVKRHSPFKKSLNLMVPTASIIGRRQRIDGFRWQAKTRYHKPLSLPYHANWPGTTISSALCC